jgi:hypothetical protein
MSLKGIEHHMLPRLLVLNLCIMLGDGLEDVAITLHPAPAELMNI